MCPAPSENNLCAVIAKGWTSSAGLSIGPSVTLPSYCQEILITLLGNGRGCIYLLPNSPLRLGVTSAKDGAFSLSKMVFSMLLKHCLFWAYSAQNVSYSRACLVAIGRKQARTAAILFHISCSGCAFIVVCGTLPWVAVVCKDDNETLQQKIIIFSSCSRVAVTYAWVRRKPLGGSSVQNLPFFLLVVH